MKRTLIEIDQAGNFTVDQQGFSGTACAETTAKLVKGIRSSGPLTEEKKPEYHNRAAAQQKQTSRW